MAAAASLPAAVQPRVRFLGVTEPGNRVRLRQERRAGPSRSRGLLAAAWRSRKELRCEHVFDRDGKRLSLTGHDSEDALIDPLNHAYRFGERVTGVIAKLEAKRDLAAQVRLPVGRGLGYSVRSSDGA